MGSRVLTLSMMYISLAFRTLSLLDLMSSYGICVMRKPREAYLIGGGKTLEPLGEIRKMKCNTLLLFVFIYPILHFKFLVYNGFNEFCFHKLSKFAFSFFYMLL